MGRGRVADIDCTKLSKLAASKIVDQCHVFAKDKQVNQGIITLMNPVFTCTKELEAFKLGKEGFLYSWAKIVLNPAGNVMVWRTNSEDHPDMRFIAILKNAVNKSKKSKKRKKS